jgi:flagellar biosynthesis/type III secretory pathway protein FliH
MTALLEWLQGPEHAELRRSIAGFIRHNVLRARMPGIEIPELAELEEIQSMLADRILEWTQEWKQEGLEEGLQKGMEKGRQEGRKDALVQARAVLLQDLERRFGPLPEEVRQRIGAVASIEALAVLMLQAGAAPSLAALMSGST